MQDTGCVNSFEYICRMKEDEEEFKRFLETLSINVTHFSGMLRYLRPSAALLSLNW